MARLEVVARKEDLAGVAPGWRAAVVIDVLRATSSITMACASGARAVYPCASREQAEGRACLLRADGVPCVLAGEEGALPIPGFDLGNSPREFTPEAVGGRAVVIVTTNGSRALRRLAEQGQAEAGQAGRGGGEGGAAAGAGPGRLVMAAAFLNAGAAAALLAARLAEGGSAILVCAGTAGRFSFDDFLCAGCLVDRLQGEAGPEGGQWELDDLARAARDAFRHNRGKLAEAVGACAHARALRRAGFADDVAFAARLDACDVVPVLQGNRLVPFRLTPGGAIAQASRL